MTSSEWVELDWDARRVRIEHQWLRREDESAPLLVFLHEGLGSVSMWRDFPAQLCEALQCRGLVYSRPGYGQSTPRPMDAPLAPDFMHRQAHELLPALLAALGATGARPRASLVLLAYVVAALLGMIPITPGGLGFVEIGLTATLQLAGISAATAVLATLAYRLVSYWLPIPAGIGAYAIFRRRYGGVIRNGGRSGKKVAIARSGADLSK